MEITGVKVPAAFVVHSLCIQTGLSRRRPWRHLTDGAKMEPIKGLRMSMDCRPWPHSHQLIRFGMIWSPRLGCKRLKSRSIGSIFLNHINLSDLSKTGETSQGQLIEFDEEKSEWTIATFSADIVHFQDQ